MVRVGIDIGGTKIKVGILAEDHRLIAQRKLWVREIFDLPGTLCKTIRELCEEAGVSPEEVISCGIGVPGTVSSDGKRLLKAPNLSLLTEDLVEKIEQGVSLPVTLVQDSRAAVWGEYLCGGGVGAKSVVCITLGTGIGTGIVLDGKLYHGGLGSAGEMGHLPVVENGRPCGCGKRGCLEKYCAGGGLDRTAEELFGAGHTAADLFSAAASGHSAAKEALQEAIVRLGTALVAVVNLLSPDCILFSGGLSEQEEWYLNPVIDYVREHCYSSGVLPILRKAVLGEDSPLIGAALADLAR